MDLSFAGTGTQRFEIPAGARLSDVRRALDYRLSLNRGVGPRRDGTFVAASATWLQLPFTDLQWMVDVMYEHVAQVSPAVEAARLDILGQRDAWARPRHQLLAELV